MKKVIYWFGKLANIYNVFIGFPLMSMLSFVLLYNKIDNNTVQNILNWTLGIFAVLYVCVIVSTILRKMISKEFIIWPLVFVISISIMSLISDTNNIIDVMQIILFESYIVYYIMLSIVKGKMNASIAFVLSLIFVVIGAYSIHYYAFSNDISKKSNDLFNALMGIFAALIGGAITLGGVAWGIVDSNKKRKEDFRIRDDEKKEEERKSKIPYLYICDGEQPIKECLSSEAICDLFKSISLEELVVHYSIADVNIKNSNNADVIMYGIMINNCMYEFDDESFIEKGKSVKARFSANYIFNGTQFVENVALFCKDVIGNIYKYECKIKIQRESFAICDDKEVPRIDYKITHLGMPVLYKVI